jgi:hypothetical protein
MRIRPAILTLCLAPLWTGMANAQAPAPSPQQAPPCIQEFFKLRDDAEKKAAAIKAANERKAAPKEACNLFGALITAQTKMLKYASENTTWCGIPQQVVEQIKEGVTKIGEVRTKVCQAAAAPPRPQGPSLSETLTSPVPDSNNIKTGRGTFDTLTGSPLGNK